MNFSAFSLSLLPCLVLFTCERPAVPAPAVAKDPIIVSPNYRVTEPKAETPPADFPAEITRLTDLRVLPPEYRLFEHDKGDLNGDGIDDHVVLVKGTDPRQIFENVDGILVDRNRRGLLVYLSDGGTFRLATKNLHCFSSENEDYGGYFPPDLEAYHHDNKLYIHYGHGKYGYWTYTFRYEGEDLALIGYDQNDHRGPILERVISMNFLTNKKQIKNNINENAQGDGEEIFEESWETIQSDHPPLFADIDDFDSFRILERF